MENENKKGRLAQIDAIDQFCNDLKHTLLQALRLEEEPIQIKITDRGKKEYHFGDNGFHGIQESGKVIEIVTPMWSEYEADEIIKKPSKKHVNVCVRDKILITSIGVKDTTIGTASSTTMGVRESDRVLMEVELIIKAPHRYNEEMHTELLSYFSNVLEFEKR